MGEYVKINGVETKIGTCEDLYWATHAAYSEAVALGIVERMPGNLPPAEYLKGDFRFRFPFPDEDGVAMGEQKELEKGLLITVKPGTFEFEHFQLCHSASCGFSHNVNIFLPCPNSVNPYPLGHSPINSDQMPVEIVQQRPIKGELWTVVRCGYCKAAVRIDRDGAVDLVKQIKEQAKGTGSREYWEKVCSRIMAGYENSAGIMKIIPS